MRTSSLQTLCNRLLKTLRLENWRVQVRKVTAKELLALYPQDAIDVDALIVPNKDMRSADVFIVKDREHGEDSALYRSDEHLLAHELGHIVFWYRDEEEVVESIAEMALTVDHLRGLARRRQPA